MSSFLNNFFKQDKVFFVFVTISCLLNPINTIIDTYLLQFVIDSISYNKGIYYILIGLLIFVGIKFLVYLFSEIIEVNIGEKRMRIVRGKLSKSIIDSFLHFGQNSGKHFMIVSSRICILVLLLHTGQ